MFRIPCTQLRLKILQYNKKFYFTAIYNFIIVVAKIPMADILFFLCTSVFVKNIAYDPRT